MTVFVATTKPHYCTVFSDKTVCHNITSKLVKHFARLRCAPTDHRLATCVRTKHLRHGCKDKSVLWYSRKTTSWCMWPPSLTVESVLWCLRAGQRHAGTPRVLDGESSERCSDRPRRTGRWNQGFLCNAFLSLSVVLLAQTGHRRCANPQPSVFSSLPPTCRW